MNTRNVLIDRIILILFLALCIARIMGEGNMDNTDKMTSAKFNRAFIHGSKSQLISFDSKEGDIEINWDVSIPFFTIPLNFIKENGEISPLLNFNTKGLSLAGLFTTILTLAVPLLSKSGPGTHYRSESQWSRMGDTINEIVLGNNYVTPCVQRVICSVISEASRMDNPTSTAKIIDGLSSHRWIKDYTNGTILQEAIRIGREGNRDCGLAYKECFVTPKILKSMMAQFGAI